MPGCGPQHRGSVDTARASSGPPCTLGFVLCSDNPFPGPHLFSRVSEQTLLVEKLTEQNSKKEATISSLRMQVQKLVRGAARRRAQGGGSAPAPLRHLLRPQQSRRTRGQLLADTSEDEAESLQHVLKSIPEVQARLGPSWGNAAEGLGS